MPIGPSVTNYHTRPASSCTWSNSISTEFRATASTTCPVISRKIGRGTTVGVGVGSSVGFTVGIVVGGGAGVSVGVSVGSAGAWVEEMVV